MVVGAENDDTSSLLNTGSVYIFTRASNTWTLQSKISPLNPGADDHFGHAVAIAGGTVVVGAKDATANGNAGQGQIRIYNLNRITNAWTAGPILTPVDGKAGDAFGSAVAIDGTTILVGAPFVNSFLSHNQGAAYAYILQSGAWVLQEKFTPPVKMNSSDNLGASVSLFNNRALIGAPNAILATGAVYLADRNRFGVWSTPLALTASDGAAGDAFGQSVSLAGQAGDFVLIGAPGDDTASEADRGSVYFFALENNIWTRQSVGLRHIVSA